MNCSVAANPAALPVEVALLGGVRGLPGGRLVRGGGRGGVAGHFEQVTADSVEPVVTGEHVGEFVGRGQAGRRVMDHGGGDRLPEGDPRLSRELPERRPGGRLGGHMTRCILTFATSVISCLHAYRFSACRARDRVP